MKSKIVLFGEYLLRLTPPNNQTLVQSESLDMHWAGSEANIAVSLSIFGENAEYISSMPDNALARTGISQLHKYGVKTNILYKENSRVGLYFFESGQGARPGRVSYDRDYSALSQTQSGDLDWDSIFEDASWFHWSGITPALNKNTAAVCLEALQQAKKRGITISADFNHRATLWNYGKHPSEVMPELLEYCDVILADADTSALYFGIQFDENNIVESTCQQLQDKLPHVKYIAMTMRNQISASSNGYTGYIWKDGELITSRNYQIDNIADRIGAGDAFMSGIIFGLFNEHSLQDTIEFATACGVMKHFITGDFNLATKEEIDTLIRQKGSGRIIR